MTIQKWTRPSHYVGAEWPDYYVFLGQNRDSDALTRSNFRVGLEALGGETGEVWVEELGKDIDSIAVIHESHWAVGWVEWIAIHESNTEAITKANEMLEQLESYPILDESDFSALENEECEQVWTGCYDAKERIRYFRNHSYTADSLSDLLSAVRGNWYAAASILHCPSDLLY